LHCWKYLGDWGPKILLFSRAAMLTSPVLGDHKIYKVRSTSPSFISKQSYVAKYVKRPSMYDAQALLSVGTAALPRDTLHVPTSVLATSQPKAIKINLVLSSGLSVWPSESTIPQQVGTREMLKESVESVESVDYVTWTLKNAERIFM